MIASLLPVFTLAMLPKKVPIRILLDVGQVLTDTQDPSVFDPLLAELRLDQAGFREAWASLRQELDAGTVDAREYWIHVLSACGVAGAAALVEERLEELVDTDLAAWLAPRPALHALLEALLDSGVELAILSNMPPGIGARFVTAWPWLRKIPHRLFSGEEGFAKPDPAFWLHFLELSGWEAGHTLFVDDLAANIEAAASLGFAVHHFTDEGRAMEAIGAWAASSAETPPRRSLVPSR